MRYKVQFYDDRDSLVLEAVGDNPAIMQGVVNLAQYHHRVALNQWVMKTDRWLTCPGWETIPALPQLDVTA